MYWPNLKFVALPVPDIIAIGVLGGGANPNLGEGDAVEGRGWYRSKELWCVNISETCKDRGKVSMESP